MPTSSASTIASIVLVAGLVGCGSASQPSSPAPVPVSPEGAPVQVWLTTGDQSLLLSRAPDLHLRADSATALPAITVDPATTYQRMIGFGAAFTDASVYLIQDTLLASQREALLYDLFGRDGGIGLSFARITMGASDFSLRDYSYDDLPSGQTDSAVTTSSIDVDRADRLPVIKRALAINPQLTLVGSPWSPPAWMKTSGSLITGTLKPEVFPSFADYFVKFVQAYGAEGVPIAAITLQNEPAFEPNNYPGMRLDRPQRAEVLGRHLGPALTRAGLKTQIWDWDHNWDLPQQPLGVLNDSMARRYVQAVAWHCYAGNVAAQTTVHSAYPDKDVYFTECSGGDWPPRFPHTPNFDFGHFIIGPPPAEAPGSP